MRLKEVREAKYFSQADLAAAAGLSKSAIAKIESGMHFPYPRTIRKLATALGVEPDDLVIRE